MYYSEPRQGASDADGRNSERFIRERSYSSHSIDDTTLNDDDPVDQIQLCVESEDLEMDASLSKFDEKYRNEKHAINDAQSVRYTAYSFTAKQNVVNELRNVGVTVLSLETLSTSELIHYMNAVTNMRLGDSDDEKCMLYTDRQGRVFNVTIAGGAEGLSQKWSIVESAYSGWLSIATIPFLLRVICSYSFDGKASEEALAMDPLLLLIFLGIILENEISHAWLSMSIFVRGTNSVASHVWRGCGSTDYPRMLLMLILMLATFASPLKPIRDIFTITGALLGCLLLLCNLGSRGWKKADLNFIDSTNIFTPCLVVLASIFAGVFFPFMGLRAVNGGTVDDSDSTNDIEKVMFHPNAKNARKNITVATTTAALVYLLSDVHEVQEALGFKFTGGLLNLAVGAWLFMGSLISMTMCHRVDSSRSKKIEPFLRRDETSPVGWVVPSIPNIVIDPILSKGKTHQPLLPFWNDIVCSIVVSGISFLIIWSGVREMQGYESSAFWQV